MLADINARENFAHCATPCKTEHCSPLWIFGSNSFRLEIGRFEHGHIQRVWNTSKTVRQGNGLDENRNLTQEAMGVDGHASQRFAERLAGFPREHVRAVATQTLREARNREEF